MPGGTQEEASGWNSAILRILEEMRRSMEDYVRERKKKIQSGEWDIHDLPECFENNELLLQMAEADKKRFELEMANYTPTATTGDDKGGKKKKKKRVKDPNAPKRAMYV